MRGRKPKPTRQKQLAGNPGKRKLNRREPKPTMSADMQPAAISVMAQVFQEKYLGELRRTKILTDVDMAAFELMSTHYAVAWRAAERLEREGLTQTSVLGISKHPLLQVFRDNSNAFRAYAVEFGMTPSARSRIRAADETGQLSLTEILFGEKATVEEANG